MCNLFPYYLSSFISHFSQSMPWTPWLIGHFLNCAFSYFCTLAHVCWLKRHPSWNSRSHFTNLNSVFKPQTHTQPDSLFSWTFYPFIFLFAIEAFNLLWYVLQLYRFVVLLYPVTTTSWNVGIKGHDHFSIPCSAQQCLSHSGYQVNIY